MVEVIITMNDFVPSIKVTFYLSADEFDLDEVTQKIGIIPTIARKKDSFPPTALACTIWALSIKEERCKAICFLFEELLNMLRPKEKLITDICKDYNIEASFEVVIHMQDGDGPEIVLPREVISFAATINAEIGFDIYCYE